MNIWHMHAMKLNNQMTIKQNGGFMKKNIKAKRKVKLENWDMQQEVTM